MIGISILLASYNEEGNIERVLTGLCHELERDPEIDFELLAYNDCSTDRTGEILDRLAAAHDRVTAVHNPSNLGLGGTFRDGLERASKQKLLMLPGDGQFVETEIPDLIRQSDGADLLVAYHLNYKIRALPRRALSWSFRRVVKILFDLPYRYYNWITIYNRSLFDGITVNAKKFVYRAEIIIKAHKLGYVIREAGAHLKDRDAGSSAATRPSSMMTALLSVLKLWWEIYVTDRKRYRNR